MLAGMLRNPAGAWGLDRCLTLPYSIGPKIHMDFRARLALPPPNPRANHHALLLPLIPLPGPSPRSRGEDSRPFCLRLTAMLQISETGDESVLLPAGGEKVPAGG